MPASLIPAIALSRPGWLRWLPLLRDRLAVVCAHGVAQWHAWRRREQDARILVEMSDRDLLDLGLSRGDLPVIARGVAPGDGWR